MRRTTENRLITWGSISVAVLFLGTAIATDWERQEQVPTACAEGQVQERQGIKSAVLNAAVRSGLEFDDGAAQDVSTNLLRRLGGQVVHTNQWVSVGTLGDQPLVAEMGRCEDTMAHLPVHPAVA